MRNINEICGELQRADQRINQHSERILDQSQSVSNVMENIQTAFGNQNEGQQAVRALYNAINQCSSAESILYQTRHQLQTLVSTLCK